MFLKLYLLIKAFIGRPVLWGLAQNGESGVKNVINLLKREFDLAMALAGIDLTNNEFDNKELLK